VITKGATKAHEFSHLAYKKAFLSGSILAAYLILGSGSYVVTGASANHGRDIAAFAATLPRKVYKYSVVPGGVYTPEELAVARRLDPVVAEHFADFGRDTKITTLKEDMYVYVSYRKGDKIYYSKKKHKVCKGEVVITDGKNYARTRCANRLTKVFKPPALIYHEPKPPEMDVVEAPDSQYGEVPTDPQLTQNYYMFPRVEDYPGSQTGAAPGGNSFPVAGLPSEVILPQFVPLGGVAPAFFAPLAATTTPGGGTGGGGTGGGTTGGTVVPEPAAFGLMFACGAVLLAFGKRLSRKRTVARS
jgi:hypothetical protein